MDINGLFDRALKAALDCRAVWPPVLTPIQLGDYGVMVGDGFRRLGNVADFGLSFRTERGPPSRLDLASADVRVTRFAGGVHDRAARRPQWHASAATRIHRPAVVRGRTG